MNTKTFHLELITPCFCGGAEPDRQAEIRAPSIRGQLRWWFRTLGGFKSLAPKPVTEQEAMIFGSMAGDGGRAGKLVIRVSQPTTSLTRKNADDLGATMNTPLGYALFPLRSTRESDGRRGMLAEQTRFSVNFLWRGDRGLFESMRALVAVWAHLGCQGFRGRRAFGALRLLDPAISLSDAWSSFSEPGRITIRALNSGSFTTWRECSAALLKWYRAWRQHGQMNRTWSWEDKREKWKGGRWSGIPAEQRAINREQPGFKFARRDHNEGLKVQGTGSPNPDPEQPHGQSGSTFRPALGLPIVQFFSSLGDDSQGPLKRDKATVNWEYGRGTQQEPKGRFASPVLLRPHRDTQGHWHALVVFVDAHKWPQGKQVFLNGQPRAVSLDLYEAMKRDPNLKPFPAGSGA